MSRHPSVEHFNGQFDYEHLPPALAHIVCLSANLKDHMLADLNDGPELAAGLRKLREATDCFVRQRVEDLKADSRAVLKNTPEPELLGTRHHRKTYPAGRHSSRDETQGRGNGPTK